MNKDIIYIEPEDDITDIISKIKSAKQKVVALVPPKKLGVLTSAINVRLIAKTAKTAKKAVVLVTANPALMKLAAISELPVAATLQSRPTVPSHHDIDAADAEADNPTVAETAEEVEETVTRNEVAEDFTTAPEGLDTEKIVINTDEDEKSNEEADEPKKSPKSAKKSADEDATTDEPSEDVEEDNHKAKPARPSEHHSDKSKKFSLKDHFKLVLGGTVALVTIVAFLVWANIFAPAASIFIKVRTTSANFSENVSFTTNRNEEDAKAGKFYLETIEHKENLSGKLVATEEKDIGEKASGNVTVTYYFSEISEESATLPAETTLTQDGLQYFTTKDITLTHDCRLSEVKAGTCAASASVEIVAATAGEKHNCATGTNFTVEKSGFTATASNSIAGGSSKVVKVVQQSDIDKAVSEVKKLNETEAKDLLKKELKDGYIIIDSSYKATTSDPKPSVELGKEADDKATVSLEVTYRLYAVDQTRIEEYIHAKANLDANHKIYELGNPYIERFTEADGGSITGKLKTTYKSGDSITPEKVLEKVQGKKIGEARSLLESNNSISSLSIEPSFFWVNSIPDDPNRITIKVEVEN